jgi:hypothetical protein
MILIDDAQTKAYDKALNFHPDDFEWENMPGQRVILKVISVKDNKWNRYDLSDEDCSCGAWGLCYHRCLLHLNGGVSGVKIRLYLTVNG